MRGWSLLEQREVVVGVAAGERIGLAGLLQPFTRVLADRLQHPVALVREAEQALLDERLQRVEVGAADLLGGLQRAAAGEDGERAEETLLLLREQVVAPVDRRPQRLLSRVGVPAALQQVEPLGEALEDLRAARAPSRGRRRARPRAGGRRGGRRARRSPRSARAGSARRRARPPRTRRAAAPRTRPRPGRAGARGSCTSRVRFGQAARSAESSGAASITCSRLSRSSSISRSPMCSASPSFAPSVCAIVSLDKRRVAQRGEADPEDARLVRGDERRRGLEREPGLARAARPGEREQARAVRSSREQPRPALAPCR